jgi:hypothetical protein
LTLYFLLPLYFKLKIMKILSFIAAAAVLISLVLPFAASKNIRGDHPTSRELPPWERIFGSTCKANPSCAKLNLKGECCPTTTGQYLECCRRSVSSSKCEYNKRCDARGLEGECCPSSNGQYLDCCGARAYEESSDHGSFWDTFSASGDDDY